VLDRIADLLDPDTLRVTAPPDESGAVAAAGRVHGRTVLVYATDPTVRGGALSTRGCDRIARCVDDAVRRGAPVVGIWQSGGAALQEGVASLDGVSRVFRAIVAASGRVPQLSLITGPAAGGAAYGPALTDIVVLTAEARVFVTGPGVVRSVTGEDVDAERLGGPALHARRSGVAHVRAGGVADGITETRRLVALLGDQGTVVPAKAEDRDLAGLLPDSPRRAYDVRPLVGRLLDSPGSTLHDSWAPNVHTELGRLAGRTVGVVANNPLRLGGCLDAAAGDKAARFVRMCDAFGIPLVVVVDVPGYLPGVRQEEDGVVRRGAKLLHAFAGCRVPRVTLITRKAYGGAYIAMNSRGLGATAVYAWPGAEIAVMGADSAVGVLHRRELAACPEGELPALRARLAAGYLARSGGLPRALELGVLDDVVTPGRTRAVLAEALSGGAPVRGDQRNVPL
jgi:acetyl-CoA/propionyl-CoA carboxylase carboxyl transferase subunit